MRSSSQIQDLILTVASNDDRIRAVLLNGSRANQKLEADPYQDFDVVYIVRQLLSFTNNHNWIEVFGERIIQQLPDEMIFAERSEDSFAYLMLFKDWNRIDLTLYPIEKVKKDFWPDSLTVCLLDKDGLFNNLPPADDKDYKIKKPSQKEFMDTCNEFWWVSTYVAKGYLRNELTYAKEMLETIVRPMFMKIMEWYIGVKMDFSVPFGKSGKFMKEYLPKEYYDSVLATYSDHQIENNWESLFVITELFSHIARVVAENLHFPYNMDEDKNVSAYLKRCYAEQIG